MMMVSVRVDRLEAGRAGADVDPLDEPVLAQLVEYAVDAGDSDPAALGSELVEDLLGGQAAILAPEQLDDGAAGAPGSRAPPPHPRRRPPRRRTRDRGPWREC